MRYLTLIIDDRTAGRTVGNLLKRELLLSASLISHLKYRPNGITKNGIPARTPDKLSAGDVLRVNISDDPAPPQRLNPAPPPVILYEDEDLLILNKAPMIEMHPDFDQLRNPSLKDSVLRYLGEGAVFHPVNRLDAETGGLLTVAKHRYACDRLRRQLHTDSFLREYLAICRGTLSADCGTILTPVNNSPAKTQYKVLATGKNASLVKLRLYTGRTHQIRIHMASLGHPLLGDSLYGAPDPLIRRTALHSAFLSLAHPITARQISLFCPPHDDFISAAKNLDISLCSLTSAEFCDIKN